MIYARNIGDAFYGLVYDFDEDGIDRDKGVLFAYTKETIAIDFWESKDEKAIDVSSQGMEKDCLSLSTAKGWWMTIPKRRTSTA